MKIQKIRIENFKSFYEPYEIDFDKIKGLWKVSGSVGSGKTTIGEAILFGLLHGVPFGLATQSIFVAVCMTILPGAFGWYQGWLNEKRCGGSIVSSWLLHGTMNFIVTCFSL
jgi:hypothetical protein